MQHGVYANNAISFKFSEGIISGVDTGVNYGSVSIKDVQRIHKITDNCLVIFSGLMSDIQYVLSFVKQELESDNRKMDPQGIHKLIQRIIYSRRSEAKPLWISAIVCGTSKKDNSVFESTDQNGNIIGAVNSKGNFWFDDCVSLNFSSNVVLPILRNKNLESLSRNEAISLMEECFRILCYKDCRSTNRIQIGISSASGTEIFKPYCIKTEWKIGHIENEIEI